MQEIITYIEALFDKTPAPILENISSVYQAMDPLYWWIIVGLLVTLLLLVRVRRLVNRKKNKTQKPDTDVAKDMAPDQVEAIPSEKDAEVLPEVDEALGAEPSEPETKIPEPEEIGKVEEIEEPENFFSRLKNGLSKTRKAFSDSLDTIFAENSKIDDDTLEEIEELLITSDIGVSTTMELIEGISEKSSEISTTDELKAVLKEQILSFIDKGPDKSSDTSTNISGKPHVIMVVGVNGVGKTTTIGKLAARYTKEGKKVLIAASDTFRAAAVEQLTIWAERAGAEIVKHKDNADPSAVAYDSMEAAVAREVDIVLVDTAGRLHTRKNLMEEMKKIKRTISKKIPDAPHETLLVVDATTGQNALTQAKQFLEAIGITSIALTKLDGTAKGGIVVGICNTLNIPLDYIGVGEQVNDLQDFDPKQFVDALF